MSAIQVTSSRRTDPRRWAALVLLCTAAFMMILDASIVVVALPSIKRDLGFSDTDLPWVISGYAVTFGGLLLLGGRSADLLGRRRMFMGGISLFALGSLVCGLAPFGVVLIVARLFQGGAAAIMAPAALSILLNTFPEGEERNRALGIWGAISAIGATAGWFVGGPITSQFGWPWIFFINVPVAGCVLALSPRLLAEGRAEHDVTGDGFDVAGAATITAALFALVYAVVRAPDLGWTDAKTLGVLAVSVALTALFIFVEARSPAPLVPLRLFRSRPLVGGSLVVLANGMTVFGMSYILTQYAQQVLGMSAAEFGISSAVMPIMAAVGSYGGQAIVTRIGSRPTAAAATLLMATGCLLLTRVTVDGSYLRDLLVPLLIFGPGIGAAGVASSIAALNGVAETDSGLASGLNNACFQIGGALGVAILSTVAVSQTVGSAPLFALTHGFRWAFGAASVFPALGFLVAILLLGRVARYTPSTAPARGAACPDAVTS